MTTDLTCSVCELEPAAGVAALPGIPMSVAFGRECLRQGATHYELHLVNLSLCAPGCDGLEDADPSEWLAPIREAVAAGEIAPWALEIVVFHDGEYKTMADALGCGTISGTPTTE